jgi:hypothetical protein
MHNPAVLENYTLVSTQVPWTYTQALMDFKVGGCVVHRPALFTRTALLFQ